jgi:deoxyribodipyrimidine photo-lyase
MKSLVWLRSDLRLEDNPALKEACSKCEEVQAVYIFSKNQAASHNEAIVKINFIVKNLFLLEKSLGKLNIPLTILESDSFIEDPKQFIGTNNLEKMSLLEILLR